MAFRCPYCQHRFEERPQHARCPSCNHSVRLPAIGTPEERAARRRRINRMAVDAARRMTREKFKPDASKLHSPRVLFGVILILGVVGLLLMRKVEPVRRSPRELPHQVALRQLNTLATALGRYRFHVGDFPPDSVGLRGLVEDPGIRGWDGPYINQLLSDPWKTPYAYRYVTNALPMLFSCGPDGTNATPDDLRPDPASFNPGTEWTNGWVSAPYRRNFIVVKEPAR